MSCFCSCWDSEETLKNGAFEEAYYPGRNTRSITEHSRGYIPWVWSRKIQQTYHLGKLLGQGAYALVHEATEMQPPHQSYAVKIIQRHRMGKVDLRHFNDEVHILLDLQHENIVQLHELYKTPDYFYIVMEKLDGGELFERLCQKTFYSEMDARNVCRTVFDAVSYCHSQRVAHRDLKPENLLLCSSRDNDDCSRVKIADFGFAKKVPRPNSLTTRCGSPSYLAPEIINYKPYDERVDNWSLGVIVYTILGGYSPFQEETNHLTFQRIRQADYQFNPKFWDGISPDAKKLIRGLLTRDPDQRLTVDAALQHPWMIGRGGDDDLKKKNISVNLKELRKFNAESKKRGPVKSVSMYWILTRR